MKTILHAVHIHAGPATVYDALTTPEGLTGWWTMKGARIDETEVIHFTFLADFHPEMKQTTLDDRKGETLLRFVQEYAQELSDEVYGTYNFNWGYYLNSLKLLCEKGAGTPFSPPA